MENGSHNYWMEMAEYDFQTAVAMLNTKRYLYVGFMLHQTIEKALKGYYVLLKSETPPFTHSLLKLSTLCNFYNDMPEPLKETIDLLEPLNIEARYPSHKERLLKELNEEVCNKLLKETGVLYKWLTKEFQKRLKDL